jgi:hypothetical protein
MNDVAITENKKAIGFSFQPTNMEEAMKAATMLAGSNMVPSTYKGQPSDTLVAMMMGSELGLNPIQSLQNIAVINGRPCIYGDAMLALVQTRPSFESITESFDNSAMTATCTVRRKGGTAHTQTYSQQDAEKAKLWAKSGPWQQYPKRMLAMRARGFALRNQFADALLGLISAEEAQDYAVNVNTGEMVQYSNESIIPEKVSDTDDGQYPEEQFDRNFDSWSEKIANGSKTPKQMIAWLKGKGSNLTDDQKKRLNNVKVEK